MTRGVEGQPVGSGPVLGIDLGGTKTAIGLVAPDGRLLNRGEILTRSEDGVTAVVVRIGRLAREVAGEGFDGVRAVGVGCPGPLDYRTGVVSFAPNLGWRKVPIRDLLKEELGRPTFVDNDANAAALGEARFAPSGPVSHLLYVTVSTGVGGGVIIDNALYRGVTGSAGEFGHMTVEPGGPQCGCGNRGCLEAISSGTAIAREARAALDSGERGLLWDLAQGDAGNVSAGLVAEAAALGDALCEGILCRAFRYLGIGVANLVTLFDPAVVALGGGVSRVGEPLLSAVRAEVAARVMPPARDSVTIRAAELGDDVGVLGAAALVI